MNLISSQCYFYKEHGEKNIQIDWRSNTEVAHQVNEVVNINYTFTQLDLQLKVCLIQHCLNLIKH